MICPYCGKAMKKGKIQVNDQIFWTPEGENRHNLINDALGVWAKTKNSILLSELTPFIGSEIKADYCQKCQKIIIDILNNN